MPENRNNSCSVFGRDTVLSDIDRITDCCRDKDCFEKTRVFLTDYGQEMISKCNSVRVRGTEVLTCCIETEEMPFNQGFYRIRIKYYVKLLIELCPAMGNNTDIEGVAVCEKQVILYGGECKSHIFRSNPDVSGFCNLSVCTKVNSNAPSVTVEVLDPVCLDADIYDVCPNQCGICSCEAFPEQVLNQINGNLTDRGSRILYASLGFFSVVRVSRPSQYLISASPYSVPDKECPPSESEAPCDRFRKMPFPESSFGIVNNAQSNDSCNRCR